MVLVVDDHAETALALKTLLELAGFASQCCTSGRDAMDLMKRQSPQVVVLDQQMPEKTGLDVLREMRQIDELARVPVLFFSGIESAEEREEARRLGIAAWLTKGREPWLHVLGQVIEAKGMH